MPSLLAKADASLGRVSRRELGSAWIALSLSLALRVFDEAMTDFLSVYNPTVLAIREILMLGNGLLHIGGSFYLGQPMPGVYSSPLLLASSIYPLRCVFRRNDGCTRQ